MCNKLYAKSVIVLHKYMQKDVYDIHQLSVIDDALLQTVPILHIKHTLTDLVLWHYEILSGILAATFLIKYCSLLDSDLDC